MTTGMRILVRPVNQRKLAIVQQAMVDHFTIKPCAACGGPEIFSKTRPLARCFSCGRQRELQAVAPALRRWRCDQCRKFYRAVFGAAVCPACRNRERQVQARDRRRTSQREVRRTSGRRKIAFAKA